MTDQTFISDDGTIGQRPVTWDGEPMYSPATVQEGLFAADAFEQMPGQLAISAREFGAQVVERLASNPETVAASQYAAALLRFGADFRPQS